MRFFEALDGDRVIFTAWVVDELPFAWELPRGCAPTHYRFDHGPLVEWPGPQNRWPPPVGRPNLEEAA